MATTMSEQISDSKRVVFTFDQQSYDSLKRITEDLRLPSMAQAVREALRLMRTLQSQADQGYSEVVVRNPDNNRERTLVIPVFEEYLKR